MLGNAKHMKKTFFATQKIKCSWCGKDVSRYKGIFIGYSQPRFACDKDMARAIEFVFLQVESGIRLTKDRLQFAKQEKNLKRVAM